MVAQDHVGHAVEECIVAFLVLLQIVAGAEEGLKLQVGAVLDEGGIVDHFLNLGGEVVNDFLRRIGLHPEGVVSAEADGAEVDALFCTIKYMKKWR